MKLSISVLGPLRVERNGSPVPLGPRLVRLLSVLLIELGKPVPASRLVEVLWGRPAPDAAATTLRSHVSHLRRALTPDRDRRDGGPLVTVGGGAGTSYRLDLAPGLVDGHRFERGCAEGLRLLARGEPDGVGRAAALMGDALALWRGQAFADVAEEPFARGEVTRLTELRRRARRGHAEALSALGRYAEVTSELAVGVADDPYDESLRELLATALYAEGRVDAAAEVCREGLTLLARRGIEAPQLRELQGVILRREMPIVVRTTVTTEHAAPRQLPPNQPRFVGRHGELAAAQRMLRATAGPQILLVTGPAGVGKTRFAIRLGHAVADQFPDGQLYVNLRGFEPSGSPASPAEVVRGFLEALGVPPQQVPASFDAQVSRYRDLLSGRRLLVVLDNARDADQVLPLLPGSASCRIVVTSRSQLLDLITLVGAHPLPLDVLSTVEARELLTHRLGAARVAGESSAVADLITGCARLPLALAIMAARAATHTTFPLAALAAELRDTERGLDAFAGGSATADLRAALATSYRTLDPPAARMFRLLSLHPSPDIGEPAAASLAGVSVPKARRLLATLAQGHLIAEHAPGRYSFHDLLRGYAVELARGHDTDTDRHAALHRLLDHYLHTAERAAGHLHPSRDSITVMPPQPAVTPEDPGDLDQALAWFTTEHRVLIETVAGAADAGFDPHAWQLAWAISNFLDRRGYWHELAAVHVTALAAAKRLADPVAQAIAHRGVARSNARLGRHEAAIVHFGHAADLYRKLADDTGQANIHLGIYWIYNQQNRHRYALSHAEQALTLYRATGHRSGQARALNNIGWSHTRLGNYQQALHHCQQALALQHELDDTISQAHIYDSLGYAHHHLGQQHQAASFYQRALELYRDVSDRYHEAATLARLGDTYHATGDTDTARRTWQQALEILTALHHPDAGDVRGKLTETGGMPAAKVN